MFIALPLWLISLSIKIAASGRTPAIFTTMALIYGLHQLLKVFIAIEATRQLSEDRQSGTLELLLVAPLPVASVIDGSYRALRAKFRGAITGLSALNLIYLAAVLFFQRRLDLNREAAVVFGAVMLGGIGLLQLDLRSLVWRGMWRAVVARRQTRAVLSTLLPIMLPPWFCIFLMFTGVGDRIGGSEEEVETVLAIWFAACVLLDQFMTVRAKKMLRTRFREMASGAAD